MNASETIVRIQLTGGAKIVAVEYKPRSVETLGAAPTPPPSYPAYPDGYDPKSAAPHGMSPEGTNQHYHFKNVICENLQVGDQCVVQDRFGFSLVTVVDNDVLPTQCNVSLDQLKHVVCKVDMAGYKAALKSESDAAGKIAMAEVSRQLAETRNHMGQDNFEAVTALLKSDVSDAEVLED